MSPFFNASLRWFANLANGTYGYKVVVTGGENAGVSNAATATVTGTASANKTASAPKE